MPIVVQKYGGSSVADPEKILNVARRIGRTYDQGNQVVVVISAMGDTTDDLIKLAHQITDTPDSREMVTPSTGEMSPVLAGVACKAWYKAISLTGGSWNLYR